MSKRWNNDNTALRFQRPLKTKNNKLSFKQMDAFKNATSLPVNFIRNFHEFLDMKVLTNTTPIQTIINNKFLPWDESVIVNKKDVRMIHTKHFNLKWNYYKLTVEEPDVCNIANYPDLNWDIDAIKEIDINKYCNKHLLFIVKKYNKINWNSKNITFKFELEDILKDLTIDWCYDTIMDKLLKINIKSELFISALFNLNNSKLKWGRLTEYVTWEFISYNQTFPWDYANKHSCYCGNDLDNRNKYSCESGNKCKNFLDLYTLKKLKLKPLNWKKITKDTIYKIIFDHPEFPWDEETLLACENTPLWFVQSTNYKWDMKKITRQSSWKDVRIYTSIKWDFEELIQLDKIIPPISILCLYSKLKWDWDTLSEVFLLDDIIEYTQFPWNWEIIKKRDNIPFRFIITFPEKTWDCDKIKTNDVYEEKMLEVYKVLDNIFIKELLLLVFNKLY